jgi:hypothetical protein
MDVWNKDVLHDSEFMPHHMVDKEDDTEGVKETYEYDYLGWRASAWNRELFIHLLAQGVFFRAQDITHIILAASEKSSAHTLTLKDLYVSFLTLSMDNNAMYVFSKVKMVDQEFYVVVVDPGTIHS